MAESDLELKVHELCLKRGWKMETVSNLPPDAIERAYNKLKEQEKIEARLKEKAAKEKAKELEQNYSEPYFLTPKEMADTYLQERNLLDGTIEMPEGYLVDDFLGPKEANDFNRGRKR